MMKKTGLFILAIGAILALFSGFNFVTREKIANIGAVKITHDQSHRLDWSPWIGVVVIAVGAGVYFLGKQNHNPIHISK